MVTALMYTLYNKDNEIQRFPNLGMAKLALLSKINPTVMIDALDFGSTRMTPLKFLVMSNISPAEMQNLIAFHSDILDRKYFNWIFRDTGYYILEDEYKLAEGA